MTCVHLFSSRAWEWHEEKPESPILVGKLANSIDIDRCFDIMLNAQVTKQFKFGGIFNNAPILTSIHVQRISPQSSSKPLSFSNVQQLSRNPSSCCIRTVDSYGSFMSYHKATNKNLHKHQIQWPSRRFDQMSPTT